MKRGIVYGLVAFVGLFALWFVRRGRDHKVDKAIAVPVLGSDERTKIILDNALHTVTRIERTAAGREIVTRSFLNTHGPVAIAEKKDGRTVLIQRTWGTELSPFAGGAFGSDFRFRVALGVNAFYVQRWELGGGLLVSPSQVRDARLFGQVGYNVYGNWLISAALDNQKAVHLIASVRFN